MTYDSRSEEVAAADANLLLIEALLDDLWEVDELLKRIDHYLSTIEGVRPEGPGVTARLLRIQIRAWREQ